MRGNVIGTYSMCISGWKGWRTYEVTDLNMASHTNPVCFNLKKNILKNYLC